jgi:hypothetical protein
MKTSTATLIAFSLLLPAAAAAQDDVESLLRSMATDQEELRQKELAQSELVRLNEQDTRLHKTYADNHGEIEGRVRRVRKSRDDYVAPRQTERNNLVNGWNGRCSAQSVGALPKERYEACGRERAQIEPRVNDLKNQIDQAYANAKREAEPLISAMQRQKTEMDSIVARTRQRLDTWTQNKVKVDQLRAKLQQTRQQLVTACGDSRLSDTALKHCHSIGWDGASKTLPPLGNIRSPFAATRNQ